MCAEQSHHSMSIIIFATVDCRFILCLALRACVSPMDSSPQRKGHLALCVRGDLETELHFSASIVPGIIKSTDNIHLKWDFGYYYFILYR